MVLNDGIVTVGITDGRNGRADTVHDDVISMYVVCMPLCRVMRCAAESRCTDVELCVYSVCMFSWNCVRCYCSARGVADW